MARGTWGGALDPSIFRVTIRFMRGGSHCQTSFKLRDVAVNDNSPQEVADSVANAMLGTFKGQLLVTDTVEGIDVLKLGTEEGGWHPFGPAEGQGGLGLDVAGQGLPSFVAANLSLKSEIRKKYGQGRMFLPIANDNYVDGNVLNQSGVNNTNTVVNVLTQNYTGDPLTHDLILVNAHPALPQVMAPGQEGYRPAIPASWYDVVSLRLNNAVTMLRSRKLGVG